MKLRVVVLGAGLSYRLVSAPTEISAMPPAFPKRKQSLFKV